MIHSYSSYNHTARVMLAVLLLTSAAGISVQAESIGGGTIKTTPLTVDKPGQTVTDDFDVKNCTAPAVVDIAASAAADEKGVTTVNSQNINGTFTVGGSKGNVAEANGIWVRDDYPGTVKLANGLNVKVDAAGNYYNTSGIYLEGVDTHHGIPDESDAANDAYTNTYNGHISPTSVHVGDQTTITVHANAPEGKSGDFLNAAALENHFGHMTVGDNVTLSLNTGNFKYNGASGFYSLFYGDTSIGNHFTSTIEAVADNKTGETQIRALESFHDHPSDHQNAALTQNHLTLGDDAHLKSTIYMQSPTQENPTQSINTDGVLLSSTDFSIGDRLTVETMKKRVDTNAEEKKEYGNGHVVGMFIQNTKKGTIGTGLTNTVTVDKCNNKFAFGLYLSGWNQKKINNPEYNPTEEDKERDTADISIKDDSHNHIAVTNSAVRFIHGIKVDSNSKLHIGNHGETSITQTDGRASEILGINAVESSIVTLGEKNQENITINNSSTDGAFGIYSCVNSEVNTGAGEDITLIQNGGSSSQLGGTVANTNTKIHLGESSSNRIEVNQGEVGTVVGIYSVSDSTVNLDDDNYNGIILNNGTAKTAYGIFSDTNSAVKIGKNGTVSIIQNGGKSSSIYGMVNYDSSTISAGDGLRVGIDYTGDGTKNTTTGMWNFNNSHMNLGNDSTVSVAVVNTSKETKGSAVSGMQNILADSSFGRNLHVQVKADNYESAEGIRNTGVDRNSGKKKNGVPATMIIGDNLSVDVEASSLTGDGAPTVEGIRNGTNYNPAYIFSQGNTMLRVGKNAHISVTAPDKVTDVSALHSFNHADAELGDGAVLTVNSHARNSSGRIINNVVKADDAGHVTFAGGMTLVGSQNAIYSTGDGSSVTATGAGRKVILGDLESADKGSIKLNLNTADSLLRGKSTIDGFQPDAATTHGLMVATAEVNDASGNASGDNMPADTELTLANGARWDMTASSQVTNLTHENGGVVNMAYNPELQRLDVDTYSGRDGVFRMKSDLNELETASKLHADKVYIDKATEGSTGLIQVHDQSFLTGHEVTGTKYQLLVTDKSGKAKFSGQSLDEGGLWDVTPTIQNGSYVRKTMGVADAKDTEWYLTKLTKSVNADTKPLLGAVDYGYGLYRNSIDTLRQRMGDLRFLKNKRDAAGIWARTYSGELDGPGYDSKYHAIQVGYDYAANAKSLYGFLGERGIASPHYDYGSSKDHSLAGAIYGTWFGDSGSYTDVVAKWGRDDSNLHTYGPYADSANFRTSSESLSVEYGKTTKLNDHGLFIEPQAQLVLGRLNDKDFTTARGKMVHLGSYDSAIGRLGFVFGQRRPDAAKPYDYYIKASVLHEFGGDRSFHLAAPDGEMMNLTNHYGSTWYEAGFGGTYRVNNSTYLYADAERSFGSDWHKKWQANVGINWQF